MVSLVMNDINDNNELVGTSKCLETVFPDAESRPGKRTFLEWKARGYFRYHKIGKRIFFNPSEVSADLKRRFQIKAIEPQNIR